MELDKGIAAVMTSVALVALVWRAWSVWEGVKRAPDVVGVEEEIARVLYVQEVTPVTVRLAISAYERLSGKKATRIWMNPKDVATILRASPMSTKYDNLIKGWWKCSDGQEFGYGLLAHQRVMPGQIWILP